MTNCHKNGWGGRCPTCDGESCKPENAMLLHKTLQEERPETPVHVERHGDRPMTLSEIATAEGAPLGVQVGGNHYKKLAIQPIEYIHANGIGFAEGNVIKYVTRWRDKGGLKDLEKAKHFIELLIDLEAKQREPGRG